MTRVWAPSERESAYALYVAASAEEFLDAYLENRITAEIIRSLSDDLHDLKDNMVAGRGSIFERATDINEADWSNAKVHEDGRRYLDYED